MLSRSPPAVALLLALTVVLVAGCSAGGPAAPTDSPPASTSTASSAPTTEDTPPTARPCPTPEALAARPLPERPEEFTAESARSFAAAYEEATVWNDEFQRRHSLVVGVDEATVLNRTEDGYLVGVTGNLGFTDCQDERLVAGDGVIRTSYFLNDSVVLRLAGGDGTADPRGNGTIVERWGSAGPE